HFFFCFSQSRDPRDLPSFPTRRSSDLRSRASASVLKSSSVSSERVEWPIVHTALIQQLHPTGRHGPRELQQRHEGQHQETAGQRSEEHTSELQSLAYLVCRLLLEKKK